MKMPQHADDCPANYIDIVFDGPPGHDAGRFVEVEDSQGRSICFGEWVQRPDGYWALRIPVAVNGDPDWRETRLPDDACPACGAFIDAVSSPEGATPKPEDLSICIGCGQALRFDDALRLRLLSPVEFAALDREDQQAIREFQIAQQVVTRRRPR